MSNNQVNPVKILEIARLYLRAFKEDDLENLYRLDSDPEVRLHFPGGALSKLEVKKSLDKKIREWEESGFSDFAVFEKDSDKFLGRAGFGPYGDNEIEMGYLFLKEYWGRGYATEVAEGLLEWAKNNIHSDRIIACAPENHIASQRVLEKIGMTYYKSEPYKGKHGPECRDIICKFYEYYLAN